MGYGYDANGNITQRGGQRYSFDIGNRLRAAAGKASYSYDGHGRRTFVSYADGSWKLQVYSLGGQLLFTRHSREGDMRHISLGGVLIAEHNSATGVRYAHTDALGSPVAWTNGAGQLLSRTRYEPYGATAAGTNPTGVGYTGHVNDADTGLVYMQQRYYDPVAGRFLSVDPVVTDANTGGQFGRYEYAQSSPLRYVDPDGLDARDEQVNRQLDESRRSVCGVGGCDGGFTEPSGRQANVDPILAATAPGAGLPAPDLKPFLDASSDVALFCLQWCVVPELAAAKAALASLFAGVRLGGKAFAAKSLGANPFKGKTAKEIAEMLEKKGYTPRGPDPAAGRGTYVNPNTGRGYHIDASHPPPKGPHVGVHRPRDMRDTLPPRDYPLEGP